jgi:uncharacterized protein YcgL (UPF0745 family)
MKCSVVRSSLKDYTYLYLKEDLEWKDLPATLIKAFGEPEFVMELELNPKRKLANEDVNRVMANLEETGYHLQLPPSTDPSGWLDLPENNATP